ncbi:hypothetical protein ACYJ1Y_11120 [Natrialbaceae archaeon A-gly3]
MDEHNEERKQFCIQVEEPRLVVKLQSFVGEPHRVVVVKFIGVVAVVELWDVLLEARNEARRPRPQGANGMAVSEQGGVVHWIFH